MDHNLNMRDPSVSLIQQYFANKTLFLTGASGFVGRFLVYKLLKDASLSKIIICMRGKRGKSVTQRFEEYKQLEIFSFLPQVSLLDKLQVVEGDVCLPDLGLSLSDQEMLFEEVNIVIHSAATIRFTEPLKSATLLHVTGTQTVVDLCHRMRKFEILLHVSSVAAWSIHSEQGESVPSAPEMDPMAFAERLMRASESECQAIESELIGARSQGKWLNSYAVTKSLAELVVTRSNLSKVVIVRPPFLASPISEPRIGWFDKPQSGAGLTALFSFGIVRCGNLPVDVVAEFMPIDVCVNGMIQSLWFQRQVSDARIGVFNISSINRQPVSARELLNEAIHLGYKYPSVRQIRPPADLYHQQPSRRYVQFKSFVTHTLFCLLIDALLFIMGKPVNLYKKTKACEKAVAAVFTSATDYKSELKIRTGKLEAIGKSLTPVDQQIFGYENGDMPLRQLILENHLRFRRHVLKEPDETIEFARSRLRKVAVAYGVFKVVCGLLTAAIVYWLHSVTFSCPLIWLPFAAVVTYIAGVFIAC